ncbi:Ubiquitin-conjugating enzyme E2 L3, partial [Taenia solium]
ELAGMKEPPVKDIFKMEDPEDNITSWTEYPIKPPKLVFKTPIYHPNVDEKGQICFPLIDPGNWKPATKIVDVIQALQALVSNPEIEHPLRADLAEEYQKDRATFNKKAAEHTTLYALKR